MMVMVAELIARHAHKGQVDKADEPYIYHPQRVAQTITDSDPTNYEVQAVAWLHDVIEDTPVTIKDLTNYHVFPQTVLDAVAAITHHKNEPRDDYYIRVKANPLALQVKLADIADNTQPERTQLLDKPTRDRLAKKYAHAIQQLLTP